VAENFRFKVICDPVHGDIGLSELECQLIDTRSFQRLRRLRQLGLASLVYPNATHTRFAHSLGVFRIMGQVIDFLLNKGKFKEEDRRKMRLAALLHDIGHYPYSAAPRYCGTSTNRSAKCVGWRLLYSVCLTFRYPQCVPVSRVAFSHQRRAA